MADEVVEVKVLVVKDPFSRDWKIALQVGDERRVEIDTSWQHGYQGLEPEGHDTPAEAVEAFAYLINKLGKKEAL